MERNGRRLPWKLNSCGLPSRGAIRSTGLLNGHGRSPASGQHYTFHTSAVPSSLAEASRLLSTGDHDACYAASMIVIGQQRTILLAGHIPHPYRLISACGGNSPGRSFPCDYMDSTRMAPVDNVRRSPRESSAHCHSIRTQAIVRAREYALL